jgi:hypothetical protein
MNNKVNNKEKTFTIKQIITMIICTLIIILVCVFMYKKNEELINEHPEYSIQGVSEERRNTGEKLFNSILSPSHSSVIKLSDERIYLFQGIEFREEVFYGDVSSDLKLLVVLENTLTDIFIGDLPDDIKNDFECVIENKTDENACIINTISIDKLKETYKDMFGSELTEFTSVNNKYNYSALTNRYYINESTANDNYSKTYYVYYNNYNSPYEHVDLATVDVSVLCVELEGNAKLYKVTDIFGNTIKEHLTTSEISTYVKNVDNYNSSSVHVTYKFDNNSSYGLTFSTIKKNNN